ncbi:MAG: ABC transporter substrate binding protein [Planctomycetota bacterium]
MQRVDQDLLHLQHRTRRTARRAASLAGAATLLLVLAACASGCAAGSPSPTPAVPEFAGKRVLFIASFHPSFPTFSGQLEGIRSVLAPAGVTVDFEFLDARRFSGDDGDSARQPIVEALEAKLDELPRYDAVIVADDAALMFCLTHRELLGDTPVAFCAVNNLERVPQLDADPNVTGVVESLSLHETIELAATLFPRTSHVLAVVDDTALGRSLAEQFDRVAAAWEGNLQFEKLSLNSLTFAELDAELDRLGDGDVVIQVVAYRDHTGAMRTKNESYAQIMPHLHCPLFTAFGLDVGLGPIGGHVISHVEQGRTAARMALQMLGGTKPADIPVQTASPNIPMFDYRQLSRFGLSTARLPAGSTILNAPRSFYADNALLVNSTLIAFGVMLTILGLVARFNWRLRREIANSQRLARQLRITLDSIGDAVIATDTNGRIDGINPVAERLTGWSRDEAVGRSLAEVFTTTTDEAHPHTGERLLTARQGSRRIVADTTSPIRDADGTVHGQVVVFRDMTDVLAMEERLRHSEKLEAVGRLAGGVAHDFNNLLTAIIGHVELMQQDMAGDPDTSAALADIRHAAEGGADLTRQLLAFARRQMLRPAVVDTTERLTGVMRMLRPSIGEGIVATLHCDATRPIRIDPGQFEQLVVNLVVNARDAMADGGSLTVSTRDDGDMVHMTVTDTGAGMDDETRERAFEPFFTTRGQAGTGLGLATCHGIVEQSGGEIWIESKPGRGTSIHVRFPAAVATGEPPRPAALAPASGEGAMVLVLEDDPGVRAVCKRTLQRSGYQVVVATTLAEARALRAKWPTIDVVISDVVLPDGRGPDLVAELRAQCPRTPVLFVSGYDEGSSSGNINLVAIGDAAFLQKPYAPAALVDALRELIAQAVAPTNDD